MSKHNQEVLKWSRECASCGRLFKCNGRASKNPCLKYEERKENGKQKNVYDEDMR